MSVPDGSPDPAKEREGLLAWLEGHTALVVGDTGTGKTWFARRLVEGIAAAGKRAALISADMGQPSVGPPTCLGLSLEPPWTEPADLWFIGDIRPQGNLLPAVVGTSRLAALARARGAGSIAIDTTGLILGPVARALKYHKAIAAGADRIVAIERERELGEILDLLEGVVEEAIRLRPAPEARDRGPEERKAYRQSRYRAHFQGARSCALAIGTVLGSDWKARGPSEVSSAPPGTLAGLLDRAGFCLGLGLLEGVEEGKLRIFTACGELDRVASVRLGRLRLDPGSEYTETRLGD